MAIVWERLESKKGPDQVMRSKVPGGWLVAFIDEFCDEAIGGLTFYPDPNHEWEQLECFTAVPSESYPANRHDGQTSLDLRTTVHVSNEDE